MAGTPYDPKKFEESKSYHQKHIELKPSDPEPYYWIGVIDWTLAFRANGELRAAYNREHVNKQVRDTDPLPPRCATNTLQSSVRSSKKASPTSRKPFRLRPDYDDAMAYLNLLYRRKADMVESADERAALLKQADDLVDKVKEIKQKRAEQPSNRLSPVCESPVVNRFISRASKRAPFPFLCADLQGHGALIDDIELAQILSSGLPDNDPGQRNLYCQYCPFAF